MPVVPPGCSSENPETIQDFITKAKAALVSVGIVRDTALGNFCFLIFFTYKRNKMVLFNYSFYSSQNLCHFHCTFITIDLLLIVILCNNHLDLRSPVFDVANGKDYGKFSGRIVDSDMHDVGRFLNRLLGLPPDIQNRYVAWLQSDKLYALCFSLLQLLDLT